MGRLSLVAPIVISLLAGCSDPPPPSPLKPVSSPIPEASSRIADDKSRPPEALAAAPKAPDLTLRDMLAAPPAIRYRTPGMPRWRLAMDAPIEALRWSPLAGLVVSVGPEVHNVTSKGLDRWRYIAGEGHKAFVVEDQEVVWSPEFERLTQIRRWGRKGWSRNWSAQLVEDSDGGFLLKDASTVSAVGPDGKDRWRASLEGLRKLEGHFRCDDGILFHGTRGMESVAVTISERGAVMREIMLRRGAIVLGSARDCTPLVWDGSSVSLLDERGMARWSIELPSAPFVESLPGGFLMLGKRGETRAVWAKAIRPDGREAWASDLPVEGEVTSFAVTSAGDLNLSAIGLCLDVSSPCAKPEGNRGPFNTLITADGPGRFHGLLRYSQGHLGYSPFPGGGMVTAGSADEDVTEITLRDASGAVIWLVTTPGRLSSGPYVGPDGEVYAATCKGWNCSPPYHLLAITGIEPADEDETGANE